MLAIRVRATEKNELADQFTGFVNAKRELFNYIEMSYNQPAPTFNRRPDLSGRL